MHEHMNAPCSRAPGLEFNNTVSHSSNGTNCISLSPLLSTERSNTTIYIVYITRTDPRGNWWPTLDRRREIIQASFNLVSLVHHLNVSPANRYCTQYYSTGSEFVILLELRCYLINGYWFCSVHHVCMSIGYCVENNIGQTHLIKRTTNFKGFTCIWNGFIYKAHLKAIFGRAKVLYM